MPNLAGPLVVALLYDGLCTFEFGIAAEIFGLDRPEMGSGWYRFASVAVEPGPLRAQGGLHVQATASADLLEQADMIVVPGWKGADASVPEELCDALRAAHGRGARLASICSGAFVLAATGLLDGATITTHWRYADALRTRFPDIAVDAASLYRAHGRIFTSAGSAAGIDLLIEIVRRDFGPEAANSVARRLVMPAHRGGGQAQFLERPVLDRSQGAPLAPLLDAIRGRLSERWTLPKMARESGMSTRTLIRRFKDSTGTSPGEWLAAERVELAKDLLCSRSGSIDAIANAVGLGSAYALRHHFRRKVGVSPSDFRSRFRRDVDEPRSVHARLPSGPKTQGGKSGKTSGGALVTPAQRRSL